MIKVETRIPSNVGSTAIVDGWPVEYVRDGADIQFRLWTMDYSHRNSRPYVVTRTGIGYSKLANALRALGKLQ